jgi:hypothetical protein
MKIGGKKILAQPLHMIFMTSRSHDIFAIYLFTPLCLLAERLVSLSRVYSLSLFFSLSVRMAAAALLYQESFAHRTREIA